MRKALACTVVASVALLIGGLRHEPANAFPSGAPDFGAAPGGAATEPARLVCDWDGYRFACARLCPTAYHRHRHRHYSYYCAPLVLGLPWI